MVCYILLWISQTFYTFLHTCHGSIEAYSCTRITERPPWKVYEIGTSYHGTVFGHKKSWKCHYGHNRRVVLFESLAVAHQTMKDREWCPKPGARSQSSSEDDQTDRQGIRGLQLISLVASDMMIQSGNRLTSFLTPSWTSSFLFLDMKWSSWASNLEGIMLGDSLHELDISGKPSYRSRPSQQDEMDYIRDSNMEMYTVGFADGIEWSEDAGT